MRISFDALIVDSDLNSRMRLRQATSALPQFNHVTMANSLASAMSALEGDGNCDVILLKPSFDDKDVQQFVHACKATRQGQGCALILLVRGNQSNTGALARSYAAGIDGFLSEPYSVEAIQEIFEIAGRIKQKKMESRCHAALDVMLREITTTLDLAAQEQRSGKWTGMKSQFAELCRNLQELAAINIEDYQELLMEVFEKVPSPVTLPIDHGSHYEGASERVRKKLAEEGEKKEVPEEPVGPPRPSTPARMVIRKRR